MKKYFIHWLVLLSFFSLGAGSSDNNYSLGDGAASNKTFTANKGSGATNPKIRYNNGTSLWDFSNDGSTYSPIANTSLAQTFTNKTLSGNTATNLISGSGTLTLNTSGTVTLPNATDTLVGKATTDTFTNKILSGNTAVTLISGSGTLTLNTSGTATIPNATDTLVGKATTDTFTNKTLTGNTAVNLISGSGTAVLNTSGTVTLPNATDTLVGKATTDNLSNKTIITPLIDDYIELNEESAPSTPASGKIRVYGKSDGKVYSMDDVGSETELGGSSATGADSPDDRKNYSITASVASSAMTVALKTKTGSNPSAGSPVNLSFRNSTLATGDYAAVDAVAATSVVIPSTATMGWTSGDTRYVFVYALNNAGTVELLVASQMLDENALHTSTTIDTSSDSLTGKYSTTGRTSKAVRYLGRVLSTQATAGTWATSPTEISITKQPSAATTMSDAEATRMGFRIYRCDVSGGGDDTAYNGTNKATVSLSAGGGTLNSILGCFLMPYQMQDGSWRIKFNIRAGVSSASRTTVGISVNGVTFPSGYEQGIAATTNNSSAFVYNAKTEDGASTMSVSFNTGTVVEGKFSGDVALASKPTWAY